MEGLESQMTQVTREGWMEQIRSFCTAYVNSPEPFANFERKVERADSPSPSVVDPIFTAASDSDSRSRVRPEEGERERESFRASESDSIQRVKLLLLSPSSDDADARTDSQTASQKMKAGCESAS
ncbi:hypothetical protein Mapa_014117 [Marchantia paleacea]|nr:hypothetical protein Mapa_014117 [Marchantia paleacea]